MTLKLVLITGAAGFVGSTVARAYSLDGWSVVGCDRLRQGLKWKNLADVMMHDLVVPEDLHQWLTLNGH
ncbi:MAG: NAD-dependent epimerase/dehydratase family protein, partial [Acidocella sp.]|nr:NAD-dependent epimerase/dehydratase family protein [Acidocella sp.]